MDNNQQEQERRDQEKFQDAMFLRYHPTEGRADRLAANVPSEKKNGQ